MKSNARKNCMKPPADDIISWNWSVLERKSGGWRVELLVATI